MIVTERSAVSFGSTRIDYRVRRSPRRRTVAVAVDPREGVLLSAPSGTPLSDLDRIVRRKARWITQRRRSIGETDGSPGPREYVSGESLLYLGRHYRLKLVAAGKKAGAALSGGWISVHVQEGLPEAERRACVKRTLEQWYRLRAKEKLRERVALWAPRLGIVTPTVLVRDQARRWGSCDARGALRLNWRIIQAPPRLLDYVILHELLHLRYRTHSRQFWRELGTLMPDYEDRRERLRRLGSRLDW